MPLKFIKIYIYIFFIYVYVSRLDYFESNNRDTLNKENINNSNVSYSHNNQPASNGKLKFSNRMSLPINFKGIS